MGLGGGGTKPRSYRPARPGYPILAPYLGGAGERARAATHLSPAPSSKGRRELCSDSTNCGRGRDVRGSEWTRTSGRPETEAGLAEPERAAPPRPALVVTRLRKVT